jgi:uncharacterized protein (DUF2235 family)
MPDQPLHPAPSAPQSHPKNIVICCDGTGNQFGDRNSNVVKLYTTLDLSDDTRQLGYYHPGLGTMGAPNARNRAEKQWTRLTGLAFGVGFRDNVFDAYRYLMEIYNEGDRIFLFGFSRGAYTARALSGLLHAYGLLRRGNEGHLPYAWRSFTSKVKQAGDKEAEGLAAHHSIVPDFSFREAFSHANFDIHYVGLWDTVSSVGWIYTPLRLLYTAQNPLIRIGRHAVSIDERRCFFRDNLYGNPLPGQDIVQVWFPGSHSDIGGSYCSKESSPSNTAFLWMLTEAAKAGLVVLHEHVQLVLGQPTSQTWESTPLYLPPPAPGHQLHHSLTPPWWTVEFFPHRYYDKVQKQQLWRIPLGARRFVPPGSILHPAVAQHLAGAFPQEPQYRPPNLLPSHVQPGASVPFPTTADLTGFYTCNAPAPKPWTSAQTLQRRVLVFFITLLDIVLVSLLVAVIAFVVLSALCGLLWLCRHLCHDIDHLWTDFWRRLHS